MQTINILFVFAAIIASASAADWTNAQPEMWPELYPDCNGLAQSPINIVTSEVAVVEHDDITTEWMEMIPSKLDNKDHTLQFTFGDGSVTTIAGEDFNLAQCHFHTPSENTVNGMYYPLEMHCVHASDDGKFAVYGQFFTLGEANPLLEEYLGKFPGSGEESPEFDIDFEEIFVGSKSYYHWMGSLTTPPCTEGISFNMLTTAGTVSMEQVLLFKQYLYEGVSIVTNNRPVMPLNGRVVELHHYSEDMNTLEMMEKCLMDCMMSRRRNLLFGGSAMSMDNLDTCTTSCVLSSDSCIFTEMEM